MVGEDLVVRGDELGHPGGCADDDRLARRVQVRLRSMAASARSPAS